VHAPPEDDIGLFGYDLGVRAEVLLARGEVEAAAIAAPYSSRTAAVRTMCAGPRWKPISPYVTRPAVHSEAAVANHAAARAPPHRPG
jgi:hypothetical protein